MKYSFAELSQNIATRRFGGTKVGVADPYLTGYHYVWFTNLPKLLPKYTAQGISGVSSESDIQNILAATCTGVTPPGGTLSKVEFTGLGGIKWAVPGNLDYGNSVSLKFLEMNKTPILDIFHGWTKLIRDYRTGVTGEIGGGDKLIDGNDGGGYTKSTYACILYYWTTAPDGRTVEQYACYDGVFPTKDPQDLYSSDIESVGKLDVEIEFNVDYAWREPWVKAKCDSLVTNFTAAITRVTNYGKTQGG